jgi:glycolate oxidase
MLLEERSNKRDWKPIIAQLIAVVGKKGIIQRREELITYECDGLTSYRERPDLVVLPKTTAEVAAVVKICDDRNIPWIARGAGTGLSGGALAVEDCLLIVTHPDESDPQSRSRQPARRRSTRGN